MQRYVDQMTRRSELFLGHLIGVHMPDPITVSERKACWFVHVVRL